MRKQNFDDCDMLFNGAMMFGRMGWVEFIKKTGEETWTVWYNPYDDEYADMYEESKHDISSLISYARERDIWLEGEDLEVKPGIPLTKKEKEYFGHVHPAGVIGPHLNGLLEHLHQNGYEKELFLVKIAAGLKWIDPLDTVNSDTIGLKVTGFSRKAVWTRTYRKTYRVETYYGRGQMYPPKEGALTSFFLDDDQEAHSFDFKPRRIRLSESSLNAIREIEREAVPRSLIFNIPHAATQVPEEVREQFLLSDEELYREQLKLTDLYADELFQAEHSPRIIAPVSRFVCDTERYWNNEDVQMADKGMGAIYTRTTDGRELRRPLSRGDRWMLHQQYYVPHQAKVKEAVNEALITTGRALIIDCHTFPSHPLPCDENQENSRPDICIGTDEFHTPKELTDLVSSYFRERGYAVATNFPYTGTYVPVMYQNRTKNIESIMIEVNRRLYMDEANGEKLSAFSDVQDLLGELWPELKVYLAEKRERA
jgi:N-formylglutamate deformylase